MADGTTIPESRHALWELTVSRIKEAARDPMALFWTFGFPIFLAVVLGLAFRSTPVAPSPIGFVCSAAADSCERVRNELEAKKLVSVREQPLAEATRALRRSKVDLVLELQPDSGSALGAPRLVFHFDPSRREAQSARLAVDRSLDPSPPPYASSDRPQTELGGRYIDFLMPGIVALNLMGSGVWGIGFTIVEARKRKLLRQLAATPMRRSHFLLSYMLSRLMFLVPEVVFLFGFGVLAFGTPIQGSLAAIAALSLVGASAFTGIGVLIAARTESTEAAAGWGNLVMMPMWLFSGVFFSYEQFPQELQPAIRALPLTALTDALRAVTNEAAPLSACAGELGILAVWTVVTFALALRMFRWQ
jgi:ABC-2 type transport system permease protein